MAQTEGATAEIVIVGGGAAGLSTAGALRHRGYAAVVLERDAVIGSTWQRRYDRLHLHTVRPFSSLAHYAIPRRYPRYLSKDQFARYLQEYAAHWRLDVRTGCPVARVALATGAPQPLWQVESACGTWRAPVVVIATGQYHTPYLPAWRGQNTYTGRFIHSADYRTRSPSFGAWLRRARKGRGWTQEELAERVGCSPALIRKLESGERRPARQVAELLAEQLGLAPAAQAGFLQLARQELPGAGPAEPPGLAPAAPAASPPPPAAAPADQPADDPYTADRARAGDCRRSRLSAGRAGPAADPDRPTGHRQDAAEPGGRRRAARGLPRWAVLRQPGTDHRSGAGGYHHCPGDQAARVGRPGPGGQPRPVSATPASAADPG